MSIEEQMQAPQVFTNDAAAPQPQKYVRKMWKTVAIIAVACLLLTISCFIGLFTDLRPHESLAGVDFQNRGAEVGSAPGYYFLFYAENDLLYPENNLPVRWEIAVNHYGFVTYGEDGLIYLGNNLNLNNGERIFWTNKKEDGFHEPPSKNQHTYIEAILYVEDHIVGYCLVEIIIEHPSGKYRAELLSSTYYPPQNGKHQNITMSHIRRQILMAKIRERLSILS